MTDLSISCNSPSTLKALIFPRWAAMRKYLTLIGGSHSVFKQEQLYGC